MARTKKKKVKDTLSPDALMEAKPKEETLDIVETKSIKCDIPIETYRTLTKLAADQEPFVKVNSYSTRVLIEHATQSTKGKRA